MTEIASVCVALLPQPLLAVTEIVPPVVLDVAEMLVELDVPVQPPGNVHVYEVAPATDAILYVFVVPAQIVEVPEIVPG